MAHQCVPDPVRELQAVEQHLRDGLQQSRQLLVLGRLAKAIGAPAMPTLPLEAATASAERAIAAVRQQATDLLRSACRSCEQRRDCPAEMR